MWYLSHGQGLGNATIVIDHQKKKKKRVLVVRLYHSPRGKPPPKQPRYDLVPMIIAGKTTHTKT